MDAKAIIRISAMPDSSLRKALDKSLGEATKASKRAAAEEVKAAKAAEAERLRAQRASEKAAIAAAKTAERAAVNAGKAAIKAAQDQKRATEQTQREATRIAAREAQKQRREAERLAREEVKWAEWAERLKYKAAQATARNAEREAARRSREAQKTARQQVRDADRAAKEDRNTARKIAFGAGGAAIGLGTAALGRVRSFQGAFGARSPEDMMAQVVELHRRLVVLSDMGGAEAPGAPDLQKKILATSARTGVDAMELVSALEAAQDRFSDLKGFSAILDQVADVAISSKTSVESVVSAMGVMRRQFKLTDAEMQQLGGAMVEAADLGSVNFDELANNFAGALGALGRNANLGGIKGAIQALALAQTLGESDVGAAEASTLGVRVVSSLNDVKVQAAVKQAFGVDVTKGGKLGGELRDPAAIIQELADKGFMRPDRGALRQAVFKDERAQRGIEVLVKQFGDNPERVEKLLNLSPEGGAAKVQRRVAALSTGIEGEAATLGARQFKTFAEGEGMQKYLEAAVKSADTLAKIEAGHPIATEVVGIAGDVLKGLAGALLAQKIFAGAQGAGSVAAGAAGASTLVKAASAASRAAGVVGVGVGSYVATTAAMDALGLDPRKIGSGLYSALHYEAPRLSSPGMGYPVTPEPLNYSEARPDDFVSREPIPWSPAPPAGAAQSAPEATLKIKVDGPARVTSVASDGFGDIELMSLNTGRRDSLPP